MFSSLIKADSQTIDNKHSGKFITNLTNKYTNINYNILGIANEPPRWNYEFLSELNNCKMALNLSRGKPIKYTSSNRIASLIGNGIYTFIDKKTKFNEIFDEDEVGSYNTFDSGIVSDASLLPGALGRFELYVPQDFGSFIGYSYVVDWEEYQ